MAIDIGYPAIDREASLAGLRTAIMTGNPANAGGTITKVEVYAYTDMTLTEVATFYRPNPGAYPNKLTTRDWEAIGTVTAGSKQSFTVNLDVHTGDYIGIKWQSGSIERYIAGGDGFWHTSSDRIPCTNYEFAFGANWIASLYGYSEAPPDPPTNVQATDGTWDEIVQITWTKSSGATGYQVYRDGVGLGWLGDVNYYNDNGADAPTITHGSITASDGTHTAHVVLSNTGASANDGTTHIYKVRARNVVGESGDSETDPGWRGPGPLTYQWYRSNIDGDSGYESISEITTSPTYDDTGAPAPTITVGTASASDGTSSDYVTLSISGESANVGAGRYYKCRHTALGATPGYTGINRGYRGVGGLTYQWERSAGDSPETYSPIPGATTNPYNDTGAPADGSGRYYHCVENADGAAPQVTNADRGYRIPAGSPLTAYSTTSDGTVDKLSAVSWDIAREATVADHLIDDAVYGVAGAEFYMENFVIYKHALYFDTSSIPADAIIDSATLSLYGRNDWSTLDFDIVIQNGQPTYPHDPLAWGDYNMAHYSGNGGSINTSGWSLVSYNIITLNEAGRSWIQKGAGAKTKFCLRSSKDIDNIEPTDESTVGFWSAEETEAGERSPRLIVHYHIPEPWTGPWNGVTISKWNGKVITKLN